MSTIITHLMTIGFTKNEARTYALLITLGEAKTGIICEKVSIPSSRIYQILSSLIQKGVVGYKLVGTTKIFFANNPSTLRALFLEKKNELSRMESQMDDIIVSLQKMPKLKETISDYKYFEGVSGIKALWYEASEILDPKDSIDVLTGAKKSFKQLTQFYIDEIHSIRVAKKVHTRIILPIGAWDEGELRQKTGNAEIRYLSKHSYGEFAVNNNFIILQHTAKNANVARGFIIKDPIFAKTFKEVFEILWKQAVVRHSS